MKFFQGHDRSQIHLFPTSLETSIDLDNDVRLNYKTKACKSWLVYELTTSKVNGRVIERSEYTEVIDENKRRIAANPEIYRKRQAIVEHPFGVIKRQ